jgi:hypothetical protein
VIASASSSSSRKFRSSNGPSIVIAGLDPAIHPLREDDGCAGQARA